MNIDLSAEERKIIRHALEVYISNLREEIVKTEKHEWKTELHNEQEILKQVIDKLA